MAQVINGDISNGKDGQSRRVGGGRVGLVGETFCLSTQFLIHLSTCSMKVVNVWMY